LLYISNDGFGPPPGVDGAPGDEILKVEVKD
jgi:hypothetical protein